MKLEPVFEVKENQLYKISGESVPFNFIDILNIENESAGSENSFYNIVVEQKLIEPEPECYNEEYLAKLRDYLKAMEENGCYAALQIIPEKTGNEANSPETDSYIACIKHATRRIKDCRNLAGIYLCDKYAKDGDAGKISLLIDELDVKHSHYVYFAGKDVFEKAQSCGLQYSSRVCVL